MPPSSVLAGLKLSAAPYWGLLAFGKAADMRLKYSIFVGAVALGLAMAPAAFARGGGGHGGGFGGGHGGFGGGFHGGFHGGHMMYGRGGGYFGYPYYPYIPGYCSEYPNGYYPGVGCYYGYAG
jgi:hypothetical protein